MITKRQFDANENVRLRWVRDECWRFDDLAGDTYNPKVNHDIPTDQLKREENEFKRQIEYEGVWGLIGEYFDGREWQQADSCWGFVGRSENGYESDIMQSTLNAYNALPKCPHCNTPIRKGLTS